MFPDFNKPEHVTKGRSLSDAIEDDNINVDLVNNDGRTRSDADAGPISNNEIENDEIDLIGGNNETPGGVINDQDAEYMAQLMQEEEAKKQQMKALFSEAAQKQMNKKGLVQGINELDTVNEDTIFDDIEKDNEQKVRLAQEIKDNEQKRKVRLAQQDQEIKESKANFGNIFELDGAYEQDEDKGKQYLAQLRQDDDEVRVTTVDDLIADVMDDVEMFEDGTFNFMEKIEAANRISKLNKKNADPKLKKVIEENMKKHDMSDLLKLKPIADIYKVSMAAQEFVNWNGQGPSPFDELDVENLNPKARENLETHKMYLNHAKNPNESTLDPNKVTYIAPGQTANVLGKPITAAMAGQFYDAKTGKLLYAEDTPGMDGSPGDTRGIAASAKKWLEIAEHRKKGSTEMNYTIMGKSVQGDGTVVMKEQKRSIKGHAMAETTKIHGGKNVSKEAQKMSHIMLNQIKGYDKKLAQKTLNISQQLSHSM